MLNIRRLIFVIVLSSPIITVHAQDIRRGEFDITFTPAQLLDAETLASVAEFISADEEITWKMSVPESYDPSRPAGLVVYISPSDRGWIPRRWQPVMDDENLIWIGADNSGNDTVIARRMLFAVLGPSIVRQDYEIHSDRIYLSGFSGGGKVSGMVATNFANLFQGAIYICGAEYWNETPPPPLEQVIQNRYVFLSGHKDFNLDLTKTIYRRYKRAGVSNSKLLIAPGMGHQNPSAKYFRQAIDFLDARE